MTKWIALAAAALGLLFGAFLWGFSRGKAAIPPPEIVRDTVTIRDTVTFTEPSFIYRYITDTLEVEVVTVERDTVVAMLPREEVTYQDSSYTAIVSGIRPKLDYLAIYPEVKYITEVQRVEVPKTNRWGLGLQAGWGGVLADGKLATGPYIGVGISWNLATW